MPVTGPSLATRFDPRANSLWTLRLVLASVVAVTHAQEIGWRRQPVIGHTLLGDLAVDGFFVISGYLVTRSALRLDDLRRFAWHRALRIMPGFWVCLAVTAFVAAPAVAALRGRPAGSVLQGEDSAPDFVLRNVALLIRQWEIAGLPGPPGAEAMNGSLWTLFYEALCYLGIGVLFALGLLGPGRRRLGRLLPAVLQRNAVLYVTAGAWAVHTLKVSGLVPFPDILTRFALLFLLGAVGHVYGHRVRFPPLALAAAAGLLGLSLFAFTSYRPLGAVPFAYLLLWLVVALPLRGESRVDASYGMYVYHWPLVVVLAEAGATGLGPVLFTVVALAATGVAAIVSWHLVEAPSLRHKDAAWVGRPPRRPDRWQRREREAAAVAPDDHVPGAAADQEAVPDRDATETTDDTDTTPDAAPAVAPGGLDDGPHDGPHRVIDLTALERADRERSESAPGSAGRRG